MRYYLVARPETIKALVITGRFPENLPEWIEQRTNYNLNTSCQPIFRL